MAKQSSNKKLERAKLILSALLCRKTNYLIVGLAPRTLVMTTINPERMMAYRAVMEDTVHVIQFTEAGNERYEELVGLLAPVPAWYHLKKMTAAMNKGLETFAFAVDPEGKIHLKDAEKVASSEDEDEDGEHPIEDEEEEAAELSKEPDFDDPRTKDDEAARVAITDETKAIKLANDLIGGILTEFDAEQYLALIHFLDQTPILDVPVNLPTARQIPQVLELPIPGRTIKLPVLYGHNIVALAEYLKKAVPSTYSTQARVTDYGKSARVQLIYTDPQLQVISMQPGLIWYHQ